MLQSIPSKLAAFLLPLRPSYAIHRPFGEWRWALLLLGCLPSYTWAQPYDKVQVLAQQAQQSATQYQWERDTLLKLSLTYPVLNGIYHLADSSGRPVLRRYQYTPKEIKRLQKALHLAQNPDKTDKAHRLLNKLLKSQPRNTALMYYLAELHWQAEEYADAATWARKAIRINDIHYPAYVLLARCELRTGNYKAALRHISFALLYNRNDTTITPLVSAIYARNRLVYDDRWQMQGHYTITPSAQRISIVYDDEPWRALAICEALWAYEPHYEAQKTQRYLQPPSEVQRQACIYAWYEAYLDWDEDERKRKCYAAQAFEAARKDELLDAFLLYEWTLVQQPTAAFLLSLQEREIVLRYLTTIRARRENINTEFLKAPTTNGQ